MQNEVSRLDVISAEQDAHGLAVAERIVRDLAEIVEDKDRSYYLNG